MLVNNEIRTRARSFLQGKWGTCATIMLVYSIITSVLQIGTNFGPVKILGSLGSIVIGGPLSLGLAIIFLRVTRNESVSVEMLFEGFKDFGRSLVAGLLMAVFTILWMLLLIVPGIIAAISYSMTFFILSENPNISANDAIKESKAMMMGHKTEFFMLCLSFIGWVLLGILSLGIAFLWIHSYMYTAFAIFYQELKSEGQYAHHGPTGEQFVNIN